jgi:RNA polymerase-binding transcription factor DksA
MRHQYHRCAHLRLVKLDVSELSGGRKGGSVILEELCDAKHLTPCAGLLECDVLPLGAKQELLLASARRLRREPGAGPLAGASEERRRELEALRGELLRERSRLVEQWLRALGEVRTEPAQGSRALHDTELARKVGPTWRVEAIDRALDAMDAGPFGFCVACGGLIELERLRLVPDTQLCVACAGKGLSPARAAG